MMGLPDEYTMRARVAPVVVVLMPAILFAATSVVVRARLAAIAGVVGVALLALASQLGRDPGKRLEQELWAQWGGSPTVRRLRFRGNTDNSTVRHHHAQIERVTQISMPTEEQEAGDPDAADGSYERAIASLRERTRDKGRFEILFAENVNYGFRRNLLGLRRWGLVVAVVTLAACGLFFLLADGSVQDRLLVVVVPGVAAGLALLLFWVVVRPEWVRVPAEAYSERLLGALEQM